MFITLPVHCNVGLAVKDSVGETTYLASQSATTSPPIPKSWQHPGFSRDPRHMVAAVAKARQLINRQTATSACQEELGDTLSVLTHVSRLASKWNLVGYTLEPAQIQTELVTRGPVVAAMPVCQSLLTHISGLMNGETSVYTPGEPELGMVSVAVLGWEDEHWVVALPWGKFSKSTSAHAWDGCVRIPRRVVVNACAMCKPGEVQAEGTFAVKLMPDAWNPPTTRPLPPNTESSRTSGKVKHLKTKPKEVFRKFNDENVTLVLKCVVTSAIIVLAVLTLVMMNTRKH